MKHLLLICLSSFLLLLINNAMAQNDCPNYPTYSSFSESCFISATTPDNPSKGKGLWLPQATFANKYGQAQHKSHIPDNRVTWALSIAHAWNYSRNVMKSVEHPKMSYWMATVLQESEWRCDSAAIWGNFKGSPVGTVVQQGLWEDGCYQIEGLNNNSAYGALMQYYPLRFRKDEHPNLIGHANFETSSLVKSFYDIATERFATYRLGWNWFEVVENTCDPYAHEKLIASSYNGGMYAFQGAQGFMTGQENNCNWKGLPATTAEYATYIADLISVLEQNTTYPVTTFTQAGSTFDGYYNQDVHWEDITTYLNEIDDLYYEIDFQKTVYPSVREAFLKLSGGNINTLVPFTELGTVIDAIILALPKEDPLQTMITIDALPVGPKGAECSGDIVPVISIEVEGEKVLCKGMSTVLMADMQTTENYTFKWKEGENVLSTDPTFVVTDTMGTHQYSLEACKDGKCYTSECDVMIEIEDCNKSCNLIASATSSINASCTTSEDGQIEIETQNGSALYHVIYESDDFERKFELEASNFTIKNVPSGIYNIKLTEINDSTCFAYTNVSVNADEENNELLETTVTYAKNCVADLESKVVEVDNSCSFQVRIAPVQLNWPSPGDTTPITNWEKWVSAGINLSSQKHYRVQPNVKDFKWGQNSWETADFGIYDYEMNTGDSLELFLIFSNSPGVSQNNNTYLYEVWNEKDEKVASFVAEKGTVSLSNIQHKVGSYQAVCPSKLENYNFEWSPILTNEIKSGIKTSGEVQVSHVTDMDYVVTANHSKLSKCILKDTITVLHNKKCEPICITSVTPTISIKVNKQLYCKGDIATFSIASQQHQGKNPLYQWYLNSVAIPQATDTIFEMNTNDIQQGDEFYLGLISNEICTTGNNVYSKPIQLNVDVCTDVEKFVKNEINVHPNPTNGKIVVDIDDEVQRLSVYSIDGKLLIQKNNSKEINLNEYSSGMYLLEIQTLTAKKTVKVYKN